MLAGIGEPLGRVAVELERGELSVGFWQQMLLVAGKYLSKVRFSPGRVKLIGREAPKARMGNRDRINNPISVDGIWQSGPRKAMIMWAFVSKSMAFFSRASFQLI